MMHWYRVVNGAMLDHLSNQIKETNESGVWRYLIALKNLLRSIESFGISSVFGINYFGRGKLSTESFISFIRHDVLARDLLNASLNYVPSLKMLYRNETNSILSYGHIRNWFDLNNSIIYYL